MADFVLSVSDFVALLNQTLEFAYPNVTIVGELANLRVSKNRWVYFDLKDDFSSVKFFGTVYQLPGPLEEGLMLEVNGQARLHPQFGFSVNVQSIKPVGEGSIMRAAALLEAKLKAEGLFDESRKRSLPYPPTTIGLITSAESAAYKDFIKILNSRWSGVEVQLADVQVQGEAAINQVVVALDYFNSHAKPVDLIVMTRGGGSADDLAVFSTEQVTRAVAGSRIPTLVAIGHERDMSLAELAADVRASTPSNAAEIMVPDKKHISRQVADAQQALGLALAGCIKEAQHSLKNTFSEVETLVSQTWQAAVQVLGRQTQLLEALSPASALKRGYAIVCIGNKTVRSIKQLKNSDEISLRLSDGGAQASITRIHGKN